MTRLWVAEGFAWDEYPGLRAGRLFSGQGDLGRHPRGETHAVADPEADHTVCGRPRASLPHEFPDPVRLDAAAVCDACRAASS